MDTAQEQSQPDLQTKTALVRAKLESLIRGIHQDKHEEQAKALMQELDVTPPNVVKCLLEMFDHFILSTKAPPRHLHEIQKLTQGISADELLKNNSSEQLQKDEHLINACKALQLAIKVADSQSLQTITEMILKRNSFSWDDFYAGALISLYIQDPCPINWMYLEQRSIIYRLKLTTKPTVLPEYFGFRTFITKCRQTVSRFLMFIRKLKCSFGTKRVGAQLTRTLFERLEVGILRNPNLRRVSFSALCVSQVIQPTVITAHQTDALDFVDRLLEMICHRYFCQGNFSPTSYYVIRPGWFFRRLLETNTYSGIFVLAAAKDPSIRLYIIQEALLLVQEISSGRNRENDQEKFNLIKLEIENQFEDICQGFKISQTSSNPVTLIFQFLTFLNIVKLAKELRLSLPDDNISLTVSKFHQAIRDYLNKEPGRKKSLVQLSISESLQKNEVVEQIWNDTLELIRTILCSSPTSKGERELLLDLSKNLQESLEALLTVLS
ncbi:MAG: hypothetical protein NZO16_02225 [Deltaproteobacteria bacterium]|nr:hypothetical protein [Deltaproteobacteria bacterium]